MTKFLISKWRQHMASAAALQRRTDYDRRPLGKVTKRRKLTAAERREQECRAIEAQLRQEGVL
jgi:hypothetical protein